MVLITEQGMLKVWIRDAPRSVLSQWVRTPDPIRTSQADHIFAAREIVLEEYWMLERCNGYQIYCFKTNLTASSNVWAFCPLWRLVARHNGSTEGPF